MCAESEKEDRALDALIVMALSMSRDREPTEEEIAEFMNSDVDLSEADKAALERMDRNLPDLVRGWEAHKRGCMKIDNERPEA